jgi:hypothetical protein
VLVGVSACMSVCTRGCACMREWVFYMIRVRPVARFIWHSAANTRMHGGVVVASRHAEVPMITVYAC